MLAADVDADALSARVAQLLLLLLELVAVQRIHRRSERRIVADAEAFARTAAARSTDRHVLLHVQQSLTDGAVRGTISGPRQSDVVVRR
jgi:hypothetical protein